MTEEKPRPGSGAVPQGRCRCGHYPTHHMVTLPIGSTSSFRLESSGPCAICGEASCRAYVPAGSPAGAS